MSPRTRTIIGWIPTILVSVFLLVASAVPKFFMADGTDTAAFMKALGVWDTRMWIGALEIVAPVLFLIPRTTTVGFVLLVGLLGGALATGLTHDVPGNWPWFPLVVLGIAMIGAYFRSPELLGRLRGTIS